MFLKKFEIKTFVGKAESWAIEPCTFHKINMVIGRNATGKTHLTSWINALSELLIGETKPDKLRKRPLTLNVYFGDNLESDNDNISYYYSLSINEAGKVEQEILLDTKNDKNLILHKAYGQSAFIWSQALAQELEIDIQDTELIAYKKLDRIQHPFLQNLFSWGNDLRYYSFGSKMGRTKAGSKMETTQINFKDNESNYIVEIFIDGRDRFNEKFIDKIKNDMERLSYFLEEIGVKPVLINQSVETDIQVIYVKEKDSCEVTQIDLSQGMFRCLSLIIQLNYFILIQKAGTIIIDDVGEGLDFSRSTHLIQLLIEKVTQSNCQLILTSNDEYIINGIDLKNVMILHRHGNESLVKVYNYENSHQVYENFHYTGLNNFDFLHSNYYLGYSDEGAD